MRRVPPSIDHRNDVEKYLDEVVRTIHNEHQKELKGFFLVAYGAEIDEPFVAVCTNLDSEDITEYVCDALQYIIEENTNTASF